MKVFSGCSGGNGDDGDNWSTALADSLRIGLRSSLTDMVFLPEKR